MNLLSDEKGNQDKGMIKKKSVDERGYMNASFRLPGDMMHRLRVMAAEEDTTITELLIEGINEVFAKRESQKAGKKK
jgi:predicted DNA-binding ribbon-helix-helix protein